LRPTQAKKKKKSETLPQKYPTQKKSGGMAQVAEYLPGKGKALLKEKKKKKE
jgi:hypothetical protein